MKIKRKILLAIPILLGIVFGFGISTPEVKAETYAGQAIWPSEYISNVYLKKVRSDGYISYKQARFMRRSEDNAFVYCLQPFVDINNNLVYNVARSDYETYLNMTPEQWDRISLLAYYGYGYGNHSTQKWYAITQVLIWRTAEPTSTIFFTDTLNGTRNDNLFVNEINEIESLVAQHNKRPNFNSGSITLPLGNTITLNDVNSVLNGFKVKEQNNASANISGNSLSITATGIGNATIKLAKEDTLYPMPPVVYFKEGTQNVFRVGSFDPLYSTINLKVVGGRVEITKRDKDTGKVVPQGLGSLSNATYGIYNAENGTLVGRITTDNNAFARSDYLPTLGRFYLREITPSQGYKLDTQKYYFTVDENNLLAKVDVYEEVITREYEITKVYASDKTQIMTPEVGVQFAIYDHNNNLVSKETTDKDGKIYISLPYGNYTLRQLTSTSGFEKIEDYYFEVRDLGPTINKVFSNAEITSRLKVIKVDQDGNNITKAGIKFKIKDLATGNYVCQTVSYPTTTTYCEFETDKDGVLITPYPLNSGNYQLEEIDQVVYGYVWNSTPLPFTIDEKADIKKTEDFDAILEINFKNQEVKGAIEINKIGEQVIIENGTYTYIEIPLPKVVLGLYDESGNLIKTLETNDKGFVRFENLKLGKYIVREISTTGNHILDNKEYEFTLKYKDQYTPIVKETFTLKNYLGKGNLDFSKTDLTSGKELPNVKIEIYTSDDKLIYSGVTDENGKIKIENLFVGKFYIIETETLTGYKLSDEKVYFEILENGEVVKASMTNEKIKGDLEFTKVDLSTGNPLPNTLIEIYNVETEELIFSGRTDENGKVVIKDLEYGKYYILEKEAPETYVLNEEKMYFEILEDGEVVKSTMTNEKIKGDLEFTKVDLSTGNSLPNTLIEVYNAETEELIFSGRTDENGKVVIKDLEYGKYYILEKEAPENYILNEEKMYFEILENGDVVKASMTNEKFKGDLEFTKVDLSTSDPLPNTLIEIYNAKTEELIFSGRTDENGKIVIKDLEYGKYYILEKEAPENYILNEEKIYFEILENGEVVKATMTNEKVEMPKTFNTDIISMIIIGSTALVGLGLLLYAKKKNSK